MIAGVLCLCALWLPELIAVCARTPLVADLFVSFKDLVSLGGESNLIRLAGESNLDELKAFFVGALDAVDNPFPPGMVLAVALDDAAPKAPDRENQVMLKLMKTIDDVLLEVLERLPQKMEMFDDGVKVCVAIFEPETVGLWSGPVPGPLQLALHERQYTETFCVAPLVFEYLSRKFVGGLPDVRDTGKILNIPTGNENAASQQSPSDREYLARDGESQFPILCT